jgi:hypothetical protein
MCCNREGKKYNASWGDPFGQLCQYCMIDLEVKRINARKDALLYQVGELDRRLSELHTAYNNSAKEMSNG